jgi:hypothetical protein
MVLVNKQGTKMQRTEFLNHADQLRERILATIEDFVMSSNLTFDREAFLAQASNDCGQLAIEALLYGTNALPA